MAQTLRIPGTSEPAPPAGSTFLAILGRQSVFRRTSPAAQQDLAGRLRQRCVRRGTRIFSEADPSDSLLLVHRGRVRLFLEDPTGRAMTLAHCFPGEIFGENAALDGGPRGLEAEAHEECTLLVLGRDALLAHLERHPETAVVLLAELSRRLRERTAIIARLGLREVSARLAETLLELARRDGVEAGDDVVLRERPTHRELAEMIGTRRETVSRALIGFARQGLVAARGRGLVLAPGLRAYAA